MPTRTRTPEKETQPRPAKPSPEEIDPFEELISAYRHLIRWTVRRTCGRFIDLCAEDAEQEVHLALLRFLSGGRTIDSPHAFFVQVSTRVAARLVKKARRLRPDKEEDGTVAEVPDLRDLALDPCAALGIREAVDSGIARLTLRRRLAVRAYLIGMNHEEIARFHGWTAASARHAVYDGLKDLRAHLREHGVQIADE